MALCQPGELVYMPSDSLVRIWGFRPVPTMHLLGKVSVCNDDTQSPVDSQNIPGRHDCIIHLAQQLFLQMRILRLRKGKSFTQEISFLSFYPVLDWEATLLHGDEIKTMTQTKTQSPCLFPTYPCH